MKFTHPSSEHERGARGAWKYQALLAALVIESLGLVFALDRTTGSAPLQHLYYVPIMLAGLWFEWWGSALAAGAAIVLYHFANPHLYNASSAERMPLCVRVFPVGNTDIRSTRNRVPGCDAGFTDRHGSGI